MHSLVTGGAGFIGSYLTESLLASGNKVTVIDDESTGSRDNLAAVFDHPHFHYYKNTVADRRLIRTLLAQADEVYHLAAAVGVTLINNKSVESIKTNINITELLLDELNRIHLSQKPIKIFLASSSEVYGKNPKECWSEDDNLVVGSTLFPRWSYGVSKAIDEFLAFGYWRECGLPVVVGRLFNVVGPRQIGRYGMVMPRFVEAALNGMPPSVYGDGRQQRCFTHVSDVVGAIVQLMRSPQAVGNVFNIGNDQPISIYELAQRVIAAVNPALGVKFVSLAEVFGNDFEDCDHRLPNLSRLRGIFDFQPQYDCDQIIQDVIDWKRRQKSVCEMPTTVKNYSPAFSPHP